MQRQQLPTAERLYGAPQVHSVLHRRNVAHDLLRETVPGVPSRSQRDLRLGQTARPHRQTFDPRGRHRFGPQQEPGQSFEREMIGTGVVQGAHGGFGMRQLAGDIGGDQRVPTSQWVGQVRPVGSAAAIRQGRPLKPGHPPAKQILSHGASLLRFDVQPCLTWRPRQG